ncbi:endolytic transglycosylase MltG [bacterium]|nr:endolytic transglycosylase MltG [candidate division CSSED10-310 bacterium]
MSKRLYYLLSGWAGLWIVALAAGGWGYRLFTMPGPAPERMLISIAPGSSLRRIAEQLESSDIISSPAAFTWLCRLTTDVRSLKAGRFAIPARASMRDIVLIMVSGVEVLDAVTIPEGLTAIEIVERLVEAGYGEREEYLRMLDDDQFRRESGIAAASLEGYLFPDTYHLRSGTPPRQVLELLIRRFFSVFDTEWREREPDEVLSGHEVVTLASLVEKETGDAGERGMIARVFRNRLERGMPLQCDPTVIYALPDFDGNLRRQDLDFDSPYNTYRYRGLPPGPICSPGQASINAALHPEPGDWVYFVARGDGTHEFNVTLRDHNRAVYTYQIRRQKSR